jgi:hypothetical protein
MRLARSEADGQRAGWSAVPQHSDRCKRPLTCRVWSYTAQCGAARIGPAAGCCGRRRKLEAHADQVSSLAMRTAPTCLTGDAMHKHTLAQPRARAQTTSSNPPSPPPTHTHARTHAQYLACRRCEYSIAGLHHCSTHSTLSTYVKYLGDLECMQMRLRAVRRQPRLCPRPRSMLRPRYVRS